MRRSKTSSSAIFFAVPLAFVSLLTTATLFAAQPAPPKFPPALTKARHVARPDALTCNLAIVVDCTNGTCSSVTTNTGTTACSGEYYVGFFSESPSVTFTNYTNSLGLSECFDSTLYPQLGMGFAMCYGTATLGAGASFSGSAKVAGNADVLGFTDVIDPVTGDDLGFAYAFANATAPTCTPVVSAPTNVTSGTSYVVSWTASSSGSSYQIDEATSSDFASPTTQTVTGTTATFKHTVTSNTTYYYRVRSTTCAGGAPGPYSNIASTLVPAPPPPPTANTRNYDAVAQYGTKDSVSQQFFIKYPGSGKTGTLGDPTYTATTDKGNMTVTPSSGTIPPGGTLVTVVTNPTNLPPGANTGTVTVTPSTGSVQTTPVSVSLVTPVASGGKTLPPANALIIPVVTHVNAAAGPFLSDVRLTNTSGSAINYQVTFTPSRSNGTQSGKITNITVNALQTIALNDIAKDFFGYGATGDAADQGFGALEIRPLKTSSLASYASSRTYISTALGTYGQFIAAIPFSQFVTAMSTVPIPGGTPSGPPAPMSLQQVAQSSKFRTNLGLVEGSGTTATGKINIYDDNGTRLASVPYTLQPGEQQQLGNFLAANGVPNLDDGRIEITVDSQTGAVSAYASVLDNKTNDPLCVMPVQAANVSATRYAVPGIAEFTSSVSNFHSDMRIFNGGTTSANVTLTYYPQGNGTPVSSTPFTLGAGQVKAIDNVLPSFFKVASGGGSVVATTPAASSLVLTGRTYSLDSAGGTYGQFIPGVSPNSGSIGVGSTALQILQLEQSSQFRSNVGLVETAGSTAHVKLTLVQPDSTVSPNVELDLAANEFRQLGSIIQTAFGIGTPVYNARVIVQVTSGNGKVAAYGSVIDNSTADPTYVPAQ